eukprot:SAG22_NODE_1057_length_5776_cov_5.548529_2_plen_115_part_00
MMNELSLANIVTKAGSCSMSIRISGCSLGLNDPRIGGGSRAEVLSNLADGDVVIFPSWLEHFVPPSLQPAATPRVTVSFNAAVLLLRKGNGVEKSPGGGSDDSSREQLWRVRFE